MKLKKLLAVVLAFAMVLSTMSFTVSADSAEGVAKIGIDDFAKVDLRVAQIKDCVPVKRAKKLLQLTLDWLR